MISARKSTSTNNKLFSINRQIYDKISSKKKLTFPKNSKVNSLNTNICITPTKLQKYTALYSKQKSSSKASTKLNTMTDSKSSQFKPSFSLNRFSNINSLKKFPSLISSFNNNILNPKTPNKKSRNIQIKFQKNATMDKNINIDKIYPSIQSLNNTHNLMHNTMKSLNTSYKKFFLNKKKINVTSMNKNKNLMKNNKNKNNTNINAKSNKAVRIKKYKIAINDEECLNNNYINNNDINDKMIKSILDLKYIQNKIQNEFEKKFKKKNDEKKNNEHINEFSFNRDFFINNYFNENDFMKNNENNNDNMFDISNKNNRCILIQSKLMANLSELEGNKRIYDENYECDTPQFTTLDEKKL